MAENDLEGILAQENVEEMERSLRGQAAAGKNKAQGGRDAAAAKEPTGRKWGAPTKLKRARWGWATSGRKLQSGRYAKGGPTGKKNFSAGMYKET
ncbi:unnamed protein product [Linum trigynum]|uniref:Uncharacterized protein n=1 Tax=Linum trigynum TaxID=586398 RepID=A0AAV2DUT3_9ROSI